MEIKEKVEIINRGEIPKGYKKTKEWKKCKFGDIAILSNKKYYPKNDVRNYRCIELEHIEQETGRINGWSNSNEQKSSKTYFKSGDVLYGKLRPYLKKYYLAEFNGVCSTEIWVINSKTNFVDNGYLFYLIQTKKFNNVANISTGTRMPRADWKYIRNTIFNIPPLPQQQKIAQILSTWDKAIELKEKLIEQKKQQKKGLMQNLLTGKVRLSGFDGEWEEIELGSLCNISTGKLDANAMCENGRYKFFTCAKEVYSINEYGFDTEALLISGNGANVGYIHYYNGKFNAYQRTYVLDGFICSIHFIKYVLDRNLEERIFKEKCAGNTPYIRRSTLSEMKIQLPSLQEQKAIAQILSTADKEIDLLTQELEQLKLQKKGLMQLLLTGIVRVVTDN